VKGSVRSRIFAAAFFVSYFAYFYITIFMLDIQRPGFGVGHVEYGFPFTYYYSHCFGGYYVWFGLVGNSIIASVVSSGIGFAAFAVWAKISSPEFRSKWYL